MAESGSTFKNSIDNASKSIKDIKNPSIDISQYILTDNQIAVKMVQATGEIDEEDAHLIVYGKLMLIGEGNYTSNISQIYVDNEIIYPECVDKTQGIPDGSPHKQWIKDTIKKVTDAIAQLAIKIADLGKEIISCMFQMIQSIIALAASAVLLPFGSGLPVGLSSTKTMISSIKNLQSKPTDFIPILQPLEYVELVAPQGALIIKPAIDGLSGIFSTIDKLTSFIPAGSAPPEIPFTPDVINDTTKFTPTLNPMTITAEFTKVIEPNSPSGNRVDVTLKATVTEGSWNYTYQWTGPNGFNSQQKEVKLEGFSLPGLYTIKATDTMTKTSISKDLSVTLI